MITFKLATATTFLTKPINTEPQLFKIPHLDLIENKTYS